MGQHHYLNLALEKLNSVIVTPYRASNLNQKQIKLIIFFKYNSEIFCLPLVLKYITFSINVKIIYPGKLIALLKMN